MKQLSVGMPSTIGSYKKLCSTFFGEDHPSIKYLEKLSSESPNRDQEEILADESQMLYLLATMEHSD